MFSMDNVSQRLKEFLKKEFNEFSIMKCYSFQVTTLSNESRTHFSGFCSAGVAEYGLLEQYLGVACQRER